MNILIYISNCIITKLYFVLDIILYLYMYSPYDAIGRHIEFKIQRSAGSIPV